MSDDEINDKIVHVVSGMMGEATNAFLILFGALRNQPTFDADSFDYTVREVLAVTDDLSKFQRGILKAAMGNPPDVDIDEPLDV